MGATNEYLSVWRRGAAEAVIARDETDATAEFRRVALPHLDAVYSVASYLARDSADAADLTQETFLRAFRFFHRFESGTNCRAWLFTILHNLFRNRHRDAQRRGAAVDIAEPIVETEASLAAGAGENPETALFSKLLDHEVREALESLSEEFRSAVVLVDLQDLTYEEAARAIGCPIGTIRSRLSRGRGLLAIRLRAYARGKGYLGGEGSS